jgi:t-SNARE complex subunit (syntaxin)
MFPASRNTAPDYNPLSQLDDFSDDDDDAAYGGHAAPTPQSLLQQQDAGLEMIEQHVEQLGRLSLQIHEELQGQNELLDEMDDDLEQATVQLDAVTRATQEFIRLSGGTKNCLVIASLTGIVIVLLLLILYT